MLFEQNNKIAIDYPFASTEVLPAAATTMTGGDENQASNPAIKSQAVFALAIALIELCMKKPLHELRELRDLNPDGAKHASTDHFTAIRLLPRIEAKAGKKYADAVNRCINLSCNLNYAKPTLQNESFRRAMYEDVVAALEEAVAFFLF